MQYKNFVQMYATDARMSILQPKFARLITLYILLTFLFYVQKNFYKLILFEVIAASFFRLYD